MNGEMRSLVVDWHEANEAGCCDYDGPYCPESKAWARGWMAGQAAMEGDLSYEVRLDGDGQRAVGRSRRVRDGCPGCSVSPDCGAAMIAKPTPEQLAQMVAFIDAKQPGLLDELGISRAPSLPEHVCNDGYLDWGTGEDCLNCGPSGTPDWYRGTQPGSTNGQL